MAKPITSIPPGTLLGGKYEVKEILGAGGMGCVYKAKNVEIGLKVALKHLHREFSKDEDAVRRFRREAKLAASIGHDNICEVIDFGTAEDGSPFLVMPRLRGMSLADLIKQEGVLHPAVIADIACQTLSALTAAHAENIVHRDLKPDNIFITTLGDRENFVKLLDFGISKIMDQDSVSGMTKTGAILGTPYYMSPEQARGRKEVDSRTDIWAVGVILYEALTGRRPFDGESYNEIMFAICDDPFPAPSEINPDVPPVMEEVVLRAMTRDPESRYHSAEEMRSALDRAKDRISAATTLPRVSSATAFAVTMASVPPEAPSKNGKAWGARRWGIAVAALVLLGLVIGIAVALLDFSPPRPAPAVVPAAVDNAAKVAEDPAKSAPVVSAPSSSAGPVKEEANSTTAGKPSNDAKGVVPKSHKPLSSAKARGDSRVKGRFNTEIDAEYE